MVFGFHEIYVLNKTGDKPHLYVVSVDGKKFCKVYMDGQPLVIDGGCKLAIDKQHGLLFVGTDDSIDVFCICAKDVFE